MRQQILTLCLLLPICLSAQLKTGWGISAGWLRSSLTPSDVWMPSSGSGGWKASIFVDKPLTHRFSLHAEIASQYLPDRPAPLTGAQHQIFYPELGLGGTEYLPMGRGAWYLSAIVFASYGIGRETQRSPSGEPLSSTDLFADPDYQRIRAGITLRMGYMFHNGLSINSAYQTGILTPFAVYPDMALRYTESTWQIVNLAYLIGYNARTIKKPRN